jgi:hypothetical protein
VPAGVLERGDFAVAAAVEDDVRVANLTGEQFMADLVAPGRGIPSVEGVGALRSRGAILAGLGMSKGSLEQLPAHAPISLLGPRGDGHSSANVLPRNEPCAPVRPIGDRSSGDGSRGLRRRGVAAGSAARDTSEGNGGETHDEIERGRSLGIEPQRAAPSPDSGLNDQRGAP